MENEMTQEDKAAFLFETTWPGISWADASDQDKKLFRDHVSSLEMFRKSR